METAAPVHFRIRPVDPHAHLFEVSLSVSEPDPAGQTLSMAAWIPGSYMIRDFARNVVSITVRSGDNPVALTKLDKQSWRCAPTDGPLEVTYRVYCWDLSVRSAHLDATHGYFNGTSVFLRVHGRENEPVTVDVEPPEGSDYARWRVATTLPAADAVPYAFGRYRAADYDELVDHPVEIGSFTLVEFEAAGVPHAMAITGQTRCDTARLAADLKRICEYHLGLFGAPAPMERYLFLTMAVGEGYGGLEHRASTSLMCSRDDLPYPGMEDVEDAYRGFLGLCSHEYFHTWNVKRIKPAEFVPYDLERESHTTLLWAFEGITSYYDDMALVRSGIISPESYLELLGQNISRVLRTPGRAGQSVAESSFDAWTKFYKQDENSPNAIVSYYVKGALVALALDLTIRRESGGSYSLDDLMRALWERHGRTGEGVTEQGIEDLAAEFAGVPLGGFFDRAVRGTEDLPLEELLADVGVQLNLRTAEGEADNGGKPPKGNTKRVRPYLGVRFAAGETRLLSVFNGGPAHTAGLSAGDVLVAANGLKLEAGNLDKRLGRLQPGEAVQLHAFRRDELMTFDLTLGEPPKDTCYLVLDAEADEKTLQRRWNWLGR